MAALIDSHNGLSFTKSELEAATNEWITQIKSGPNGVNCYQQFTFVLNLINKSAATVLACLATEQMDCAFVLSDFSDPDSLVTRVKPSFAFIGADHGLDLSSGVSPFGCPLLIVDIDQCKIVKAVAGTPNYQPEGYDQVEGRTLEQSKDIQYLTFSSGSTGQPKGIYGSKYCVNKMNTERAKLYPYDHSVNKDGRPWAVAVNIFLLWECFRPLQNGGTCVVVRQEDFIDPHKMLRIIDKYQINELLLTASFARHFMATFVTEFYGGGKDHTPRERITEVTRNALSSLHRVWQNGEAVTEPLRKTFINFFPEHCDLVNLYSISECYEVGHGNLRESNRVLKLFPDVTIKIDPKNSEVIAYTPTIRFGYFKSGEKEMSVFAKDFSFYRTGDRGEILVREGKELDLNAEPELGTTTTGDGKPEPNPEALRFGLHGRVSNFIRIKGRFVNLEQVQNAVESGLELEAGVVKVKIEDDVLTAYIEGQYDTTKIQNVPKYCGFPEWMPDQFIATAATPNLPSASGKASGISFPAEALGPAEILRAVLRKHVGVDVLALKEPTTLRMIGITSIGVMRLRDALEKEAGLKFSVGELYKISDIRSFTSSTPTTDSLKNDASGIVSAVLGGLKNKEDQQQQTNSLGNSYFITGATGYLGGWLVNQLSEREGSLPADAKVYLLARKSEDNVRKSFADRGLKLPVNLQVVFLEGDNSKPQLGLSDAQIADIQRDCKYYYHCAAHVVFGCSYSESRPGTVKGAENILSLFAGSHPDAQMHYVSTNGIYPPHFTASTGKPCRESQEDFDDYLPRLKEGYGWSKWVAEKATMEVCTNQSVNRALRIIRPGNIGWSKKDGRYNANDFQTLVYFACRATNQVPDQPSWNFEITPVDELANFMLDGTAVKGKPSVHNVIGQRQPPKFYLGESVEVVPMVAWMDKARSVLAAVEAKNEASPSEGGKSLANALESTIASFEEFETLDMYLGDTNDYFTENSLSFAPNKAYADALSPTSSLGAFK